MVERPTPMDSIHDQNDTGRLLSVQPVASGYSVTYEGQESKFKQPDELTDAERERVEPQLFDAGPFEEGPDLPALAIDFDRLPNPSVPMPAALERSDGGLVMYRQRTNWLSAASGAGKTWAAMLTVRYLLPEAVRVVWLDYDNHTGEDLADRAPVLGMADMIRDSERFLCLPGVGNNGGWEIDHAIRQRIIRWLQDGPAGGFIVLDSVTAARCPIDGDPRDWLAEHIDPYQHAGIGVLALDHISHQPHGGPTGWKIKGATLNGVMLRATGRCWDRQNDGNIDLWIDGKDRAGRVANTVDGDVKRVAHIRGTWRNGTLGIDIGPPANVSTCPDPREQTRGQVFEYLRDNPRCTVSGMKEDTGIPRATIYRHLDALGGEIRRERKGREVLLYLADAT